MNDDDRPAAPASAPPTARAEIPRKPSTTIVGSLAEERAVEALQAAGYRIVARNFRCKLGELDVVAYDRGVLVFVEVRSRADARYGHAAEMVTWKKRQQVTRVAGAYLALKRPRFHQCRFDVVAITGDRIDIVRDAWRLGL